MDGWGDVDLDGGLRADGGPPGRGDYPAKEPIIKFHEINHQLKLAHQ